MPRTHRILFDTSKCCGLIRENYHDLSNRWFGRETNEGLELSIVETAYLLISDRARIIVDDEEITSLEKFMEKAYNCLREFFWPSLLVYKDLRDRGRRVKVVREGEFIIKDKHGALRMVKVLEEGHSITLEDIVSDIEKAIDNALSLVIAVVSLQGDITYYEVGRIDPRK
ncbi:MAG: endonuclease [Crenarchaeota archaeon]|nr:endonuclease [Thermoproteota archaeon]